MIGDVDTCLCQMWIVERLESVELLGTKFSGTVAAKQMTIEIDTYLRYHGVVLGIFSSSNLYRGDEILFAIGTQLVDRQLRTCKDNGLGEILQHIGEGRGGISHRIGTMQHHKTIVVVIVVCNDMRQVGPHAWCHVAGVNRRIKLIGGNLCVKLIQFWHILQKVLEVERLQSSCLRITIHSNRTPSVYE